MSTITSLEFIRRMKAALGVEIPKVSRLVIEARVGDAVRVTWESLEVDSDTVAEALEADTKDAPQ
jgi:hypothetical protein